MQNQLSISNTIAFNGVDVVSVEVQVSISKGLPSFVICGLPDKAINESKDRIRSALSSIGIALPAKRIVVNMSPANIQKEGSHYDLPIALGLLQAIGILPADCLLDSISMGELGLSSALIKVPGILLASIYAYSTHQKLICPYDSGGEAACGGEVEIIAAKDLANLIQHLRGEKVCHQPLPKRNRSISKFDFSDIIGNGSAKRAMEIAAAGGHHMLMIGSPGVGKSMLAVRMPSIMPDLSAKDALEVSMIHRVAGLIDDGLITTPQFREPHHNASVAAILGGGRDCKPGEISLAHKGILFLDEITLWHPSVLNGLRESLETGYISIARANAHLRYPAQYQLISAMNPCPCGRALEENVQCNKLPQCMQNYMNKVPGPIFDRFSMILYVNRVNPWEPNSEKQESSAEIRARVLRARAMQAERQQLCLNQNIPSNKEDMLNMSQPAVSMLNKIAARKSWSNRQYYNTRRISRTIADLAGSHEVKEEHIAEGSTYMMSV